MDNLKNQDVVKKALTPEALTALTQGDVKPLVSNLGDTEVKLKAELYGTSGANLLVGASYAGNGGKIEREARWNDVLDGQERTITARDTVNALADLTRQVRGEVLPPPSFKAARFQAVGA